MRKTRLVFSLVLFYLFSLQVSAQWFQQYSGTHEPLFDCYFFDNQNGWAVGGKRLKTTDGGATWIDKGPNGLGDWYAYSVYFLNDSIGFLGGDRKIFKTTNGGDSWNIVHESLIYGHDVHSFDFVDSLIGWGAGGYFDYGNFLVYTYDGGENWSELSVPTDNLLNSIAFKDTLTGFAVGNKGLVIKTTNGGNTWELTAIGLTSFEYLSQIQFVSESTGWIMGQVSNYASIFRTTDGGYSWHRFIIGNNTAGLTTFHFIDNQLGWAGGDYIFYTSNGGINWEFVQNSPYHIGDIYLVDRDHGWAVGSYGLILSSSGGLPAELTTFKGIISENKVELFWTTATELNNHGFEIERSLEKTTWVTIGFRKGKGTTSEPQDYSYSDDISEISSSKLYYRLKQIDFNGSSEFSEIVEVEIAPSKYALQQNYPNPFNPSTTIQYAISSRQFVTLKVYDVLGKEILTLVNEEKSAGSYEIDFNASHLASGIYYYQLRAGDYVETKKMILMK